MSELSAIVNVDIALNSTAVSGQSFSNILLIGPKPEGISLWTETTAVAKGDIVMTGVNTYECIAAGTTGTTAPTATSADVIDGSARWKYIRPRIPAVGQYSSFAEVSAAGWAETDEVSKAARVAFSQNPRPTSIFIAPIFASETALSILNTALRTDGWYMIATAGIPENQFETIAEWTEAHNKMFVYTYVGDTDPVSNVFYRTAGYFGKENSAQAEADVPNANLYLGIAAAVKCLSYPSGQETWAFKTLASVFPSELSTAEISGLENNNINWYEKIAGVNMTRNGKVKAGEWIDIIRFRDWLQNEMQYRILNLLLRNPKVPFTNSGISLVENQMIASLKAGVDAGGIAPDEFDASGNLIPGYKVHVPDSSEITDSQRASRTLSDCTFEANIAGAIHVVKIRGSLVYPV